MSVQLHDDDIIARLRAGAPGYPDAGPDAGHTLAAARRALRRRRGGGREVPRGAPHATPTTLRPDGSPQVGAGGFTWDPDAGLARVEAFVEAIKRLGLFLQVVNVPREDQSC